MREPRVHLKARNARVEVGPRVLLSTPIGRAAAPLARLTISLLTAARTHATSGVSNTPCMEPSSIIPYPDRTAVFTN